MSTDRDTTRVVRSWLMTDEHESADRVLDAVLDQLDTTPQRRAGWPAWRTPTMNKFVTIGLGAAAVVAVLFVGAQLFGSASGGVGAEPTQSATPVATAEPTPDPTPSQPPGAFNLSLPQYPVSIDVIVPSADWSGDAGGGTLAIGGGDPPGGAGVITFVDPEYYVYGDPCQWSETRPDTPSTTVDELVAALSAQASREASAPVDITLDGYTGKSITLHVPDDADFAECDQSRFASWGLPNEDPARWHQGPGQIDDVWILDVDGNLVVIDAMHYAGTPEDVVAELSAIVESSTFGEQP